MTSGESPTSMPPAGGEFPAFSLDLARQLVEANPYPVSLADADGRFVYGNRAFFDFFKAPPPTGRTLFDDPFLREAGREDLVADLKRGETVRIPPVAVDRRLIDPALPGRILHVGSVIRPLRAADGTIERYLVITEDFTDRVEAEERLTRSLELTHALINAPDEPFFLLDRDGRILETNERMPRLFGRARKDVLERNIWELIPPEYGAFLRPRVEGCFATGRGGRHVDDFSAWGVVYESSLYPVKDAGGRVTAVAVFALDATEKVAAERKFKESLALTRALLNAPNENFCLLDPEGRLLETNEHTPRLLGIAREELIGRTLWHFFPPAAAEFRRAILAKVVSTGEALQVVDDVSASGRVFMSSLHPVKDAAGTVTAVALFTLDVTEKTVAERRLAESRRELDEARKLELVGRLAGGVSHDFNNLLTGIRGHASILRHALPAGDPQRGRLDHIIGLVDRGATLVRDLLGFARGGKYEILPVDLNALVRDSLSLFARTRHDVRVVLDLAEGPLVVAADRVQLEQVLLNLVFNAAEAMPSGGTVTVSTGSGPLSEGAPVNGLRPGEWRRLVISDDGSGIGPEHLPHIFEPFYSTKEKAVPCGMGLASAQGIVAAHGGAILVESEVGRGSTFTVLLPAAEAAAPAETPGARNAPPGNERILVVDDEPAVLETTRDLLESLGYGTGTAGSGAEALDRVAGGSCDLVLLDVLMPGMSGLETLRRLRARRPGLPVLLMSGYASGDQVEAAVAAGAAGFIAKPFSGEALAEKVRAALDGSPAKLLRTGAS